MPQLEKPACNKDPAEPKEKNKERKQSVSARNTREKGVTQGEKSDQ